MFQGKNFRPIRFKTKLLKSAPQQEAVPRKGTHLTRSTHRNTYSHGDTWQARQTVPSWPMWHNDGSCEGFPQLRHALEQSSPEKSYQFPGKVSKEGMDYSTCNEVSPASSCEVLNGWCFQATGDETSAEIRPRCVSLGQTVPSLDRDDTSLHQARGKRSSDAGLLSENHGERPRKRRHFWQYNMQARGPKRPLSSRRSSNASDTSSKDPHILDKPVDPVFNGDTTGDFGWKGLRVKHTGKARRGDGNDLTPNPKKLVTIGKEIEKIDRAISSLEKEIETSANERSNRKEKNKLASRGCRLKKKAQHEANKIKLHGLERQHHELLDTTDAIRAALLRRATAMLCGAPVPPGETMTGLLHRLKTSGLDTFVHGRSADFVNEALAKLGAQAYTDGPHHRSCVTYQQAMGS